MTQTIQSLSEEMINAVNQEMRHVLEADGPPETPFYGMLHYHMGWVDADWQPIQGNGGKRIRPLLVMLSCLAAGGAWRRAVPAAAAVELLHNFSLVHDDIQDASPTRRGRATLWTIWNTPQAINSGDALFALAHLAMSGLQEQGVSDRVTVRALRRFDETCIRLTQGQYADMDFEGRERVSVDEYMAMIEGKTAVLLSLCAELGALVAGQDDETVKHYAAFGRDLGLAFQVLDDILGIWGDESVIGKSAATDIETRKKTLPVLYGLSQSETLQALYAGTENGRDFVPRVVAELDRVGARDYARQRASAYSEGAIDHLEAAQPLEPGRSALHNLADRLLKRKA